MAQHPAIEVIPPLQFGNHHILRMVVAGLAQHGLMQAGIEGFALHPHRRHPQLLEHVNQLLVEPLVAAVQALGFLVLGIKLLAGPLEVVHHRQDLAEGGAGDLQALVLLVAGLALAEVVDIGGNPHGLGAQTLVLAAQGRKFRLQLLLPGAGNRPSLAGPVALAARIGIGLQDRTFGPNPRGLVRRMVTRRGAYGLGCGVVGMVGVAAHAD